MTNEQKQRKPPREKRPADTWGMTQAEYLASLKDQLVTVAFANGKGLKGTLIGTDTFNIFLRSESLGVVVMIPKHAIRYLRPESPG